MPQKNYLMLRSALGTRLEARTTALQPFLQNRNSEDDHG